MRPIRSLFLACLLCLVSSLASGGLYRLGAGDKVWLSHTGQDAPAELTIDADGNIRLPYLPPIHLAGNTLNEAEEKLAKTMVAEEIYVSPRVTLAVIDYAPVIVGGDVEAPGRFAYVPGMTVASAIALAGGLATQSDEGTQSAREAALEALGLVVRLARLKADLKGHDKLEVSAADVVDLPSFYLPALIQNEQRILDASRDRIGRLEAHWAEEIETISAQLSIFEQRISTAEEAARRAREDANRSHVLQARGLQTAARASAIALMAANSGNAVLALQSARISAVQGLAEAERAMVVLRVSHRKEMLEQIANLTENLLRARQRMAAGGRDTSVGVDWRYEVQSLREGRSGSVKAQSLLLPGETLIVSPNTAALHGSTYIASLGGVAPN
jgi:protein involved in polysaccharide export with SLBB domain